MKKGKEIFPSSAKQKESNRKRNKERQRKEKEKGKRLLEKSSSQDRVQHAT